MKSRVSLLLIAAFGCAGGQAAAPKPAAVAQGRAGSIVPRVNPMESESDLMQALRTPPGDPETTEWVVAKRRAQQVLIAFQSLASEMCSCISPECATAVEIRLAALDEAYGDLSPDAFSDAQLDDVMVAAVQMAECEDAMDRRGFGN